MDRSPLTIRVAAPAHAGGARRAPTAYGGCSTTQRPRDPGWSLVPLLLLVRRYSPGRLATVGGSRRARGQLCLPAFSWRERASMRKNLLVGLVLTVAAVLVVFVSAAFDLELEPVALLGVALGAVV